MTSEPRANEQAEKVTPQEPMPSPEQQTQVSGHEAVAKNESAYDEPGLPEGVSERTRREFEKLKSQLAEERAKNKSKESPFDSLRVTPQSPMVNPIYDENSGFVDVTELENLRKIALEAHTKAEQIAQERQREREEQQTREALSAYPELDPESKEHDQQFYKLTRAVLIDSMVNPNDYEGKSLTYRQAADIAKEQIGKALTKAEKLGATKAIEQLTPKEQAAFEATGRSDRRVATVDYSEMSERTRKNDLDAIVSRLKNIPPVAR